MKAHADRPAHIREHAVEDDPIPVGDRGHDHGHGHGHGHSVHDDHFDPETGAPLSTMKGYVTGFVLSVVLTVIPFWLVMGNVFDNANTTTVIILAFAAVQIVVHMVYFLHMSSKSESGWTMLALIFTVVLVVITLTGSLWIMFHVHTNTMPVPHEMRIAP